MTTLSSTPIVVSRHDPLQSSRQRTSPNRLGSPPTAFSASPGRRMRSDSPAPIILHSYGNRRNEELSSSEGEEGFPPSISQRRGVSRSAAHRRERAVDQGEAGRLLLPVEGDKTLKEKRSFERTRKWAEEAENLRRSRMGTEGRYAESDDHIEGLASDRSLDGSSASTLPPRTPSPAPPTKGPPRLSLTLSSETPTAILSIDDIIRQHSASAQSALSAAKDRARRELGLAPSPEPSTPGTATPASFRSARETYPKPALRRTKTSKSDSPPAIPSRTSSSPTAKVHVIQSRSSSMNSPTFVRSRHLRGEGEGSSPLSSPAVTAIRFQTDDTSSCTTPIPLSPKQSIGTLSQTPSKSSQKELPIPPRTSTPSSPVKQRPSKPRASAAPPDEAHEMALHLRSAALNKFLSLPRAYPERPLNVSYAEVGKPDGYPVMLFLGIGCVRYLIALYDQIAQAFGLRIICVDRWGYGKTDQVDPVDRGLIEWSGVIGQVARKLGVKKFQMVAHSAGTPYAMAVARRYPDMIRGKIHLLAPWVGQDHEAITKWLKWVPGGVIRTATAADYRIQTYILGKAPNLQFASIGFDARTTQSTPPSSSTHSRESTSPVEELKDDPSASPGMIRRASTVFGSTSKPRTKSIYGTVASASTLNLSIPPSDSPRFRSPSGSPSPQNGKSPSAMGRSPGLKNLKNLAGLRSMQSLSPGPPSSISKDTSSSAPSTNMLLTPEHTRMAISASELDFGLGEGFDSFGTDLGLAVPLVTSKSRESSQIESSSSASISRKSSTVSETPDTSLTSIPASTSFELATTLPPSAFPDTSAFSTALSQASHAECEPGTTSDILRILLNKPYRPWGFRYEDVVARTHVWVGTEDKLINDKSVEWMKEACGSTVEKILGEGHNLMSNPTVLCDLFKMLGREAREGKKQEEKKEKEKEVKERADENERYEEEKKAKDRRSRRREEARAEERKVRGIW